MSPALVGIAVGLSSMALLLMHCDIPWDLGLRRRWVEYVIYAPISVGVGLLIALLSR